MSSYDAKREAEIKKIQFLSTCSIRRTDLCPTRTNIDAMYNAARAYDQTQARNATQNEQGLLQKSMPSILKGLIMALLIYEWATCDHEFVLTTSSYIEMDNVKRYVRPYYYVFCPILTIGVLLKIDQCNGNHLSSLVSKGIIPTKLRMVFELAILVSAIVLPVIAPLQAWTLAPIYCFLQERQHVIVLCIAQIFITVGGGDTSNHLNALLAYAFHKLPETGMDMSTQRTLILILFRLFTQQNLSMLSYHFGMINEEDYIESDPEWTIYQIFV
jgi:hypothetical protein